MASTSKAQHEIPELDLVAIAKTTRKSLDRLASFSNMQSSSDPLLLLTKISNKILALIHLIDASMLVAQLGYHLASDAMIICDPEETDWDSDISVDSLRTTCGNGYQQSKTVVAGFRDIKQEIYKIAASTKDNMFVVLVPPDVSHVETMKIHMKDIGTDLVANLNLLSDFSRAATKVSDWWEYVKEDLESPTPSLLPPLTPTQSGATVMFEKWSAMKNGFQQYYNIINAAHERYPNLLSSSSAAWKSVAAARSASPSSLGHERKHIPSAPAPTEDIDLNEKPKGIKLFSGIFGWKTKTSKGKKMEDNADANTALVPHEKKDASELRLVRRSTSTPASTGFYRTGTPSSGSGSTGSSIRARSRLEQDRKEKNHGGDSGKIKSSLSCCSISLFGDYLGCHANGFKMC